MAKEVAGLIKLQIKGGAANPSPPVGPALGAKGVNIMEFCKQFNSRTQDRAGKVLPVVITVDRKSTRLNSSHVRISYAVFCLKKKTNTKDPPNHGLPPALRAAASGALAISRLARLLPLSVYLTPIRPTHDTASTGPLLLTVRH